MEFLSQNIQMIAAGAALLLVLFVVIGVWRAFSPRVSGGRRGQRLGVSEYYEVDKDRRLVIVRRDGVEHLILIGGPQDIVIEPNIGAADSVPPGAARLAPRAPVFKTQPIRTAPEPAPAAARTREDPEL
jgi:hypothetical protein